MQQDNAIIQFQVLSPDTCLARRATKQAPLEKSTTYHVLNLEGA